MNTVVTIIEFIIAFGLLMFIHEFGHFTAARLLKIEVEEFGFGFPPRLVKLFNWKGTDITLNWIPFGAFVRPKGENDPSIEGGLAAAKPWKRLVVLFAGPFMNLLLGVLLYSIVISAVGTSDTSRVVIADVTDNSPAAQAGLMIGDEILSIDNNPMTGIDALREYVNSHGGEELAVQISRQDDELTIDVTPQFDTEYERYMLGVALGNPAMPVSWFQAVPFAVKLTADQSYQILMLPIQLIRGAIPAEQARLVSPVGVYSIYSQVREQEAAAEAVTPGLAILNILNFFGMISVVLGISNLLPIPALDGGRILFVLPELVIRKRVPARYENMIHFVGFTLLIGLMVFLMFQDIVNPVVLP